MDGNIEKSDQVEDRLVDFGVRVARMSEQLPRTELGRYYANQILRASNAPAPMYGEARCSESSADFVHKMKLALKELNETRIWMKMIERYGFFKPDVLTELKSENFQLIKIFSASIATAKKNAANKKTIKSSKREHEN